MATETAGFPYSLILIEVLLSTITEGGIQVKLCEITVTVHANSPQPTHNGTCHSEELLPSFCPFNMTPPHWFL
ncbi:hypothetical protein AMECASPLE_027093 [Ameca splendens]|uniref:Uncharacterized protein n=1 Tax=Ameca splendens TaxID=208324 RepID=A0ABV0ZQ99_9TELE